MDQRCESPATASFPCWWACNSPSGTRRTRRFYLTNAYINLNDPSAGPMAWARSEVFGPASMRMRPLIKPESTGQAGHHRNGHY